MFEPEISATRKWIATAVFLIVAVGAFGSTYATLTRINTFPRTTDASVEAEVLRISAGLPGRIKKLAIRENDSVTKGQLLFTLEDSTYRLLRDQALAQLNVAVATLKDATQLSMATEENAATAADEISRAQTNLALAKATVARLEPLAKEGVTSKQSLDVARTAVSDAEVSLKVAGQSARAATDLIKSTDALLAGVQAAKAALALAEHTLSRTKIRAKFDGKITGLTVTEGAWVLPEAPLFSLIDTASWHAVGFFRETDLAAISNGQPVRVRVQSNPDTRLNGQVESIGWGVLSPDAFTINGVLPFVPTSTNWVRLAKRFPVRVSLDNATQEWLRVGASATLVLQPVDK